MLLTESVMIKILREEYENRLHEYLGENIQMTYKSGDKEIDIWKDADQCKIVHDESGIMYTFGGYENEKIKLYLPDEPRFTKGHKGNKLLTGDTLPSKMEYQNKEDKISEDDILDPEDYYSGDVVDQEVSSNDSRDFILVDKKEFIKNYSLA